MSNFGKGLSPRIVEEVCKEFGIDVKALCSSNRTDHVATARHFCFYFMHVMAHVSLTQMGSWFGLTHGAAWYGVKNISGRREHRDIKERFDRVERALNAIATRDTSDA